MMNGLQNLSESSSDAINVLLVDDDLADRRITSRCLNQTNLRVDLRETCDVREVRRLAGSGKFQIILMDYGLPEGDALDLFADLLEKPCSQRSSVVVLTGRGDERIAAESIQRGVQEYLSKAHLTPDALRHAIEGAMEKSSLSKQRELREQELHRLSFYDSLTSLPNRQLFMDRLEQEMRKATRSIGEFSVLMMDLNKFKQINDTLGHHIGDRLLVETAARMQSAIRSSDTVARLGGDEFAALLPATGSIGGINCAAEKILEAFERPINIDGIDLDIGVSVGAAIFPEHGADAQQLLRVADQAMYSAKRGGSAAVVCGNSRENSSSRETCLLDGIDRAIKNDDELFLVYQPQVSLEAGQVIGAEALIRWCHPELGLVMPMDFVPLAEQSDARIDALTLKTVEMTLAQARDWDKQGHCVELSINLSACVVHRPQLIAQIKEAISFHHIDPRRLCFEVTETGLMANPGIAARVLASLAEMGCRISIDDFGTGYSSLKYLSEFSIDEIKIDQVFVGKMTRRRADAIIVESVLALGQSFDAMVVAEGIEDIDTQQQLISLGCKTGQGYFYAKALMPDDFSNWCDQRNRNPVTRETAELKRLPTVQTAANDAWSSPLIAAARSKLKR